MTFENYKPPSYWVLAEITKSAHEASRGYRYRVHGRDYKRLDTLADAMDAIKADMESCAAEYDASGLIYWGKSDPREYAVWELRTGKRVY